MANQWVRLWVDMPNDPKWRTVSRISKQPISLVISVFVHLMCDAANASERGVTQCDAEDVASALDVETDQVLAVLDAMNGRVLDGKKLIGWDKRQPTREDDSRERTRAYRERMKTVTHCDAPVTQCDAPDTDTDTDTDTDKEHISVAKEEGCRGETKQQPPPRKRAVSLSQNFELPQSWNDFARAHSSSIDVQSTFSQFKDYWLGNGKPMKDWDATWRNWIRREKQFSSVTRAENGSHGFARNQQGRNRAERDQATNITILQEWLDDERRQPGGVQPTLVGPG